MIGSPKVCHFSPIFMSPEIHPLTGVKVCEREDDAHVFKVILLPKFVGLLV